jgi:hypothetical protein
MAKRKINKSEEIRQELTKSQGRARPSKVVAALKERGVQVTPGQVGKVKSKGSKQRRVNRVVGAITSNDIRAFLAVQKLVDLYGAKQVKLIVDEVTRANLPF